MASNTLTPSNKDKATALLLCCLGYAGLAGLHYFYTGRIVKGLVYLFTGGIFVVGTVIDTIVILRGDFRDNIGAPLSQ